MYTTFFPVSDFCFQVLGGGLELQALSSSDLLFLSQQTQFFIVTYRRDNLPQYLFRFFFSSVFSRESLLEVKKTWYDAVNYAVCMIPVSTHFSPNLHSSRPRIVTVHSNTVFLDKRIYFVSDIHERITKKKIWIHLHLHVIWFIMYESDGFEQNYSVLKRIRVTCLILV